MPVQTGGRKVSQGDGVIFPGSLPRIGDPEMVGFTIDLLMVYEPPPPIVSKGLI
jgi:hypothetical protein